MGWVLVIKIKQMIFLDNCTYLSTNIAKIDLFNNTSYDELSLAISVKCHVFMELMRLNDDICSNKNLVM